LWCGWCGALPDILLGPEAISAAPPVGGGVVVVSWDPCACQYRGVALVGCAGWLALVVCGFGVG
jgi:hypothetical protein